MHKFDYTRMNTPEVKDALARQDISFRSQEIPLYFYMDRLVQLQILQDISEGLNGQPHPIISLTADQTVIYEKLISGKLSDKEKKNLPPKVVECQNELLRRRAIWTAAQERMVPYTKYHAATNGGSGFDFAE